MRLGPIGIAIATACMAITPLMAQEPVNHEVTDFKLNEPILIPGKVLPAGNYQFSILNAGEGTGRNIVEIRNTDTNEADIVIALNNFRQRTTDKTVLEFWETPAEDPPALRAWFYPGELYGVEFAYPTKMAKKLAAHAQVPVPNYEPGKNNKLDMNTAKNIEVKDVPHKQKKTMSRR